MAEEVYYAPLAHSRVVQPGDVLSRFSEHGLAVRIQEHSSVMCWLYSDKFKTQFVVSTTSDERKEIGLITMEFVDEGDDQFIAKIERIMTSLGLSCDPEAQYK